MATSIYSGFFAIPQSKPEHDAQRVSVLYGPFERIEDAMEADDGGGDNFTVVRGVFVVQEVHIEERSTLGSSTPQGWDSIDTSVETEPKPSNVVMADKEQLPKDSRWDARSSFMSAVVYNCRRDAKNLIGEHHALLTDQDLLDAYGDAYLCESPDDAFAEFLRGKARERGANV